MKPKSNTTSKEITRVLDKIGEIENVASAEYMTYLERLDKLAKIQSVIRQSTARKQIDPNIVLSCGITLASIFMIRNYEDIGPWVSKSFGWIPRPRI